MECSRAPRAFANAFPDARSKKVALDQLVLLCDISPCTIYPGYILGGRLNFQVFKCFRLIMPYWSQLVFLAERLSAVSNIESARYDSNTQYERKKTQNSGRFPSLYGYSSNGGSGKPCTTFASSWPLNYEIQNGISESITSEIYAGFVVHGFSRLHG